MNLIQTRHLNTGQSSEILLLTESCRCHDGINVSIPLDADNYFLLYDNQKLISVLSLFFPEKTLCECSAFTLPVKRRYGAFHSLFKAALKEVERQETLNSCETDLYFPVDPKCADTMAVLDAIETDYWYSEYMMEYRLEQANNLYLTEALSETEFSVMLQKNTETEYQFIQGTSSPTLLGYCSLEVQGSSAYFYGFEIEKKLRRKGIGFLCLKKILEYLTASGLQTVSLQVSEQNLPALSLYKKTGFQITETLSYYLY